MIKYEEEYKILYTLRKLDEKKALNVYHENYLRLFQIREEYFISLIKWAMNVYKIIRRERRRII